MREEIAALRRDIPATVTIGASADPKAISALLAGADTWYSVAAGLWPHDSRALAQAALSGDEARTAALNAAFEPLWALFRHHGGLRVIAAAAELTGRVAAPCLPEPLLTCRATRGRSCNACWQSGTIAKLSVIFVKKNMTTPHVERSTLPSTIYGGLHDVVHTATAV